MIAHDYFRDLDYRTLHYLYIDTGRQLPLVYNTGPDEPRSRAQTSGGMAFAKPGAGGWTWTAGTPPAMEATSPTLARRMVTW
jgi:hypothetical protein